MPPSTKTICIAAAFALLTILLLSHRQLAVGYYGDYVSGSERARAAVALPGQRKRMERFDLSRQECRTLYPQLFEEIESAKTRGKIGKPPRRDNEHGFLRARIHNGNLYVINRGEDVWHRQYAIASSIYRALITAPQEESIPNIEFTFCVNDHPQPNIWSLARSEVPGEVNNTWLMPDYGYWSWPEPHIGSVSEVREAIAQQDIHRSWDEKIDKAVWRGTVKWNQDLRSQLLEVSHGKPWADIEELEWGVNDLSMEDFCKYRFLVYTEGVTYSGRLKYQQLCRSVIITTPMKWRTFLSPMLVDYGDDQNIVVIKEDWSDLEDWIHWLQTHPEDAELIAENNIRTFRDVYLSNGVETCYWRELFRAWAEATDPVGEPDGTELGVRWESFLLMGSMDWIKQA